MTCIDRHLGPKDVADLLLRAWPVVPSLRLQRLGDEQADAAADPADAAAAASERWTISGVGTSAGTPPSTPGGGSGGGSVDTLSPSAAASPASAQGGASAAQLLFELLDTEGAGVLSVRQLLVALSPASPSEELRAALARLGLELVKA